MNNVFYENDNLVIRMVSAKKDDFVKVIISNKLPDGTLGLCVEQNLYTGSLASSKDIVMDRIKAAELLDILQLATPEDLFCKNSDSPTIESVNMKVDSDGEYINVTTIAQTLFLCMEETEDLTPFGLTYDCPAARPDEMSAESANFMNGILRDFIEEATTEEIGSMLTFVGLSSKFDTNLVGILLKNPLAFYHILKDKSAQLNFVKAVTEIALRKTKTPNRKGGKV